MKEHVQELIKDGLFTIGKLKEVLDRFVVRRGFVILEQDDVDYIIDNSDSITIGVASGEGENRVTDALDDVLKKVWKPNDTTDCFQCMGFVEYGQPEPSVDEFSRILEGIKAKVGDEVDILWGADHNPDLGGRFDMLLLIGWKNKV